MASSGPEARSLGEELKAVFGVARTPRKKRAAHRSRNGVGSKEGEHRAAPASVGGSGDADDVSAPSQPGTMLEMALSIVKQQVEATVTVGQARLRSAGGAGGLAAREDQTRRGRRSWNVRARVPETASSGKSEEGERGPDRPGKAEGAEEASRSGRMAAKPRALAEFEGSLPAASYEVSVMEHTLRDARNLTLGGLLDLNRPTSATKSTMLHTAVWFRKVQLVRLLLEHGADPNAQNLKGNSPVLFACELAAAGKDDAETVLLVLLVHGGDPSVKNFTEGTCGLSLYPRAGELLGRADAIRHARSVWREHGPAGSTAADDARAEAAAVAWARGLRGRELESETVRAGQVFDQLKYLCERTGGEVGTLQGGPEPEQPKLSGWGSVPLGQTAALSSNSNSRSRRAQSPASCRGGQGRLRADQGGGDARGASGSGRVPVAVAQSAAPGSPASRSAAAFASPETARPGTSRSPAAGTDGSRFPHWLSRIDGFDASLRRTPEERALLLLECAATNSLRSQLELQFLAKWIRSTRNRLLSVLPVPLLNELARHVRLVRVGPGEVVHGALELPTCLYMVHEGSFAVEPLPCWPRSRAASRQPHPSPGMLSPADAVGRGPRATLDVRVTAAAAATTPTTADASAAPAHRGGPYRGPEAARSVFSVDRAERRASMCVTPTQASTLGAGDVFGQPDLFDGKRHHRRLWVRLLEAARGHMRRDHGLGGGRGQSEVSLFGTSATSQVASRQEDEHVVGRPSLGLAVSQSRGSFGDSCSSAGSDDDDVVRRQTHMADVVLLAMERMTRERVTALTPGLLLTIDRTQYDVVVHNFRLQQQAEVMALLHQSELSSRWSFVRLRTLATGLRVCEYEPGSVICTQGHPVGAIFVVSAGAVRMTRHVRTTQIRSQLTSRDRGDVRHVRRRVEVELGPVGRGSVIGEEALHGCARYDYTCSCPRGGGIVTVLYLPRAQFWRARQTTTEVQSGARRLALGREAAAATIRDALAVRYPVHHSRCPFPPQVWDPWSTPRQSLSQPPSPAGSSGGSDSDRDDVRDDAGVDGEGSAGVPIARRRHRSSGEAAARARAGAVTVDYDPVTYEWSPVEPNSKPLRRAQPETGVGELAGVGVAAAAAAVGRDRWLRGRGASPAEATPATSVVRSSMGFPLSVLHVTPAAAAADAPESGESGCAAAPGHWPPRVSELFVWPPQQAARGGGGGRRSRSPSVFSARSRLSPRPSLLQAAAEDEAVMDAVRGGATVPQEDIASVAMGAVAARQRRPSQSLSPVFSGRRMSVAVMAPTEFAPVPSATTSSTATVAAGQAPQALVEGRPDCGLQPAHASAAGRVPPPPPPSSASTCVPWPAAATTGHARRRQSRIVVTDEANLSREHS